MHYTTIVYRQSGIIIGLTGVVYANNNILLYSANNIDSLSEWSIGSARRSGIRSLFGFVV